MRIGIVGSGIAGLVAGWSLGRQHDVTVYERHARPGMDAQSLEVNLSGVQARVDVPLRVIYEGYYPTLLKTYRQADIELEQVSYSASFSQVGEATYFRYENCVLPGGVSLPFVKPGQLLGAKAREIIADLARFLRDVSSTRKQGQLAELNIDDYLKSQGYSEAFRYGFLLPAFSGICTCSLDSVKRYPASIIANYLTGGVLLSGVRRVVSGVQNVVSRLLAPVQEVRCEASVADVRHKDGLIQVRDSSGEERAFDHLIIATQANQALQFLNKGFAEEHRVLSEFEYEKSRVVMHTDIRLAPRDRKSWCPVNFVNEVSEDSPMATIWMNSVQPELRKVDTPLFQTWNPIVEPREECVLSDVGFERPVVTMQTEAAIASLQALHAQPGRQVWFCGSYASQGVPLLESAAHSAVQVTDRILGP